VCKVNFPNLEDGWCEEDDEEMAAGCKNVIGEHRQPRTSLLFGMCYFTSPALAVNFSVYLEFNRIDFIGNCV
jgi:hypothetical protein